MWADHKVVLCYEADLKIVDCIISELYMNVLLTNLKKICANELTIYTQTSFPLNWLIKWKYEILAIGEKEYFAVYIKCIHK